MFLPAAAAEGRYGYSGLRSEFLQLTGAIPPLPDAAFGTWFSWCVTPYWAGLGMLLGWTRVAAGLD